MTKMIHRWEYVLTSFAVSFFRFVFNGIVVASTELGGKWALGMAADGVIVALGIGDAPAADDVKIDMGFDVGNVDVFAGVARS